MAAAPIKPLRLAPVALETRQLPGGGLLLRSRHELRPYPRCLGVLLRHWARRRAGPRLPRRARRGDGGWRRVTYAAALDVVERLAGALLERGLGPDRPVALLSDNGVDHGLLQLAALHVGIPAVPVSPAYSLLAEDHAQLRYILELVRPGLVYAADGDRFAGALRTAAAGGAELVVGANPPDGLAATRFDALLAAAPGPAVEERFAAVGPDTIAKILFTSGSTGKPKGVINTQRMLGSNQQALAQAWPFLEERPPVIVDWLPWSHTFGGNHNFNLVLRNGGTLYVDGGKPAPGLIETTVRNLREVPSTLHFNVPRGFDMLIPFLERDAGLRETFFRDLDALFYAAAALPQHLWERLEGLSILATGRRVVMLSAWGSTETAPSSTQIHFLIERAGVIGLPGAGTEIKLAPVEGQARAAGQGAQRDARLLARPELDGASCSTRTDSSRPATPASSPTRTIPRRGIVFDGRLAENFKLTSGHLGPRRRAAPGGDRRRRARGAGRGGDRPRPRGDRPARLPQPGRLPLALPRRGRGRAPRRADPPARGARPAAPPASPPTTPRTARAAGASPAPSCWPSRRRSRPARSPTRGTSTSAPCWSGGPRWSSGSIRLRMMPRPR